MQLREPGVLISDENSLKHGLEEFKVHVLNMPEPYKEVYSHYAENTRLQSNPLQMSAIGYDPQKDAITYNAKFLKLPQYQQRANALFSHELAHRYDVLNVSSWKNVDYNYAIVVAVGRIAGDVNKYSGLYESLRDVNPAVQDILSALSDNKLKVQYGHKTWDAQLRAEEIFANMSYIKSNYIEVPEFEGVFDNIFEIFERMFSEGV